MTPSHDPNDYECGLRHHLPQIQVIGLDGCMMSETCSEDFAGLDRYEARKKIIARFEELGLLDRIEDNVYSPGRSERSGVIVEPLVMKQWFVHSKPLAKMAIDAVSLEKRKLFPKCGRRPTTTSCTTSTNGVFLGSSGGDIRFRHGMAQMDMCSWPWMRKKHRNWHAHTTIKM